MDHQRFSNGRFDAEPYAADTADCSFYNERESGSDNNKFLGKMYNHTFDDEPQIFKGKLGSNQNFHPALNSKFKKRVLNQPLKLDKRRISRFQKQLAAKQRVESEKNTVKIPSINPNRNSINFSSSRVSRLMKNSGKGLSTSRNRNIKLNKSLNGMPRLGDTLQPGNPSLNTLNNSNERLDVGSGRESIDPSGSRTGRKLFNFKRDGSDNPIRLQRKIKDLNKALEDKDAQINFLKKTIKFTESNEVRIENQVLYQE